jgi:hypothetical protein
MSTSRDPFGLTPPAQDIDARGGFLGDEARNASDVVGSKSTRWLNPWQPVF